MRRMISSNVLIIGVGGLGIEIAGVKSLTIYDPQPASFLDLSSQFYLHEDDIGKPRAESSLRKLSELNEYVPVSVLREDPFSTSLSVFQVVVATDMPLDQQLRLNEILRANNIAFISAETRGLFASVFCDFGNSFVVTDQTGEPPIIGMISSIAQDGIVTCSEDSRHGLEDGDFVVFREVKGMTELNDNVPRKVSVIGPFSFCIQNFASHAQYVSGGIFEQVKQQKTLDFKPLALSLKEPDIVVSDFAKIDRSNTWHLGFNALHQFWRQKGRLPLPQSKEDAKAVLSIAQSMGTVDEFVIDQLAFGAMGNLAPMAAFIGGLVAQEVLKACSGKFHPLYQHFYFDALECLSNRTQECSPIGCRYDGQIAVFGQELQECLNALRVFVVGAGAIGCELLKLFALMGVGTSVNGGIHVTDMDNIEKSNLNRQFLFRPWDVSKPKAKTAADAVLAINPSLNIFPQTDRVGIETENIFGDAFFNSLDLVANALDNVEARRYMDRRCVYYRKPLLESGTLGTKGNTQIIIPHLTESYSSSQDPPEKSIPFCTLHNFPNSIEHTIEWAMDFFHGSFRNEPEQVNSYLSQPLEFIDSTRQPGQGQKARVEGVIRGLVTDRPLTFNQCVTWARLKFEEYFSNQIQQLLYNFPRDALTLSGTPFWTGPKRAPAPVVFDPNNKLHMDFIVAAANLRSQVYGLKGCTDTGAIRNMLSNVIVPEFKPKSGVRIQTAESETKSISDEDDNDITNLIAGLPQPSALAGFRLTPVEFEKDDDSNYHIDLISAAANLRAACYEIARAGRSKVKLIAGKIIPAIATATAVVAGLSCLELLKILEHRDLSKFKNGFVNLALPFFGFSEPVAAQKQKYYNVDWTIWDRFDISADITLGELLEYFKQNHRLTINMLSYGASMLYGFIRQKDKLEERLNMPISKLVEQVSKKPVPSHVCYLVLEILAEDENGEDVEVPYVNIKIRE